MILEAIATGFLSWLWMMGLYVYFCPTLFGKKLAKVYQGFNRGLRE